MLIKFWGTGERFHYMYLERIIIELPHTNHSPPTVVIYHTCTLPQGFGTWNTVSDLRAQCLPYKEGTELRGLTQCHKYSVIPCNNNHRSAHVHWSAFMVEMSVIVKTVVLLIVKAVVLPAVEAMVLTVVKAVVLLIVKGVVLPVIKAAVLPVVKAVVLPVVRAVVLLVVKAVVLPIVKAVVSFVPAALIHIWFNTIQ